MADPLQNKQFSLSDSIAGVPLAAAPLKKWIEADEGYSGLDAERTRI